MSPLEYLGAAVIVALGIATAIFRKFYMGSQDNETIIPIAVEPPDLPVQPSLPPNKPSNMPPPIKPNMLKTFCDAIALMEGANPANNNEGNCRCSPVGYAPMYGHVICNPNHFAVFPTAELGRMYLENMVHHRILLHPDWTFYDFFASYAPSTDGNNPKHYAEWVANRCAQPPLAVLSKVLV